MSLVNIIEQHRVVVCVGSGGVGKTTTSAAISVAAVNAGRRVLCLTIDPAKRLANSLGLASFDAQEQQVDPALLRAAGVDGKGSLHAMMLDMKGTFDELVHRYAHDDAQRERILDNQLYRYVSTSLAGTQEYMAMEKLHAVRDRSEFDLIVLDTPPTTNALDFLEAPQKLVGAIDSPMMRWFIETFQRSQATGLLGKSAALVLRGLSKFTGAQFLELVAEFIVEINALFGGFKQRAQAVYDDLRGDDVAFVIVTSPDQATVNEALYFGNRLREYDITPKAVVVNRVHQPLPPTLPSAQLVEALAQHLPHEDATTLMPKLEQAAQTAQHAAAQDRIGVNRLQDNLDETLTFAEVPAFDTDVHDLKALYALTQHFA